MTDKEFERTREVVKSKQKYLKSQGKGNGPKTSEILTKEEIDLLYQKGLLGSHSPESLINTVWLNNVTLFGMRPGEEQRKLQWDDVTLKEGSDGRRYLTAAERTTKTRQGDTVSDRRLVKPRAYETGTERCPVRAYEAYKTQRGPNMKTTAFYLTINPNRGSQKWYTDLPMGKNKLNSLLKTMATKAGITRKLTNHGARKFTVQTLLNSGISVPETMQITGHKNQKSITSYSVPNEEKLQKISDSLTGFRQVHGGTSGESPSCQDVRVSAAMVPIFGGNCNVSNVTVNVYNSGSHP